jgi:hypothetical protein
MTERYHANNKKTPQGVANVEVILFNHLMQKGGKSKQSNGKSKQSNGKSKQSNGKDFISS